MVKVNCDVTECTNNTDKICSLKEIHMDVSYGRSTDYVHEFRCRENTTR